ncbi:MAG: N-acetylmuramoyl-L-alanine amidase [Gemmatimonadetes bacterium]|nr:N-acetylmuramoyl-L-alanine amidase [Gemmatimonadota bacterium]
MSVLLSLSIALQVAAAVPTPLTVKVGDRVRQVPVAVHPGGGLAVRADALAEALGGQLVVDARRPRRTRFEVGTLGVDLEAGSALAIVANDTVPLPVDVVRVGATLLVPMMVVTDLLPRLGSGLLYDAPRGELRRFSTTVAGTASAGRGAAASPRATPPRSAPSPAATLPAATPPVSPAGVSTPANGGTRQRVVVVDAGHGGPDRGMSGPIGAGPRIFEKNVTLDAAKALRTALQARGVRVVMTRTTDTLIALSDRGRIANQARGDLFVSLHVNAANPRWKNPGGARGFETYFLAEAKTEDERRVEAMENEAIRFEAPVDASRDDPLGFIIRDMAQNEHLRESSRLAELIQAGMRSVHPGPNRGVKQAGFRVLVTAFMPAVLVEIGFGTNRTEAAWMTSTEQVNRLAATLADAIVAYLAQYERKVGG